MICYRRFLRKQLVAVLVILFIGLWFFIKSKSLTIISKTSHWNSAVPGENQQSRETDLELDRLSNIEKENESAVKHFDIQDEYQEMVKKYNDSLKKQEIEEDAFHPFHLQETKYADFSNFKINFTQTNYNPEELRTVVKNLNVEQLIYNREKLKGLPKDYVVIIVQVHKRVEYFKELLDSLQRSKGIENVLLVISHDYYTDEMNALIRMIKFCPVSEI